MAAWLGDEAVIDTIRYVAHHVRFFHPFFRSFYLTIPPCSSPPSIYLIPRLLARLPPGAVRQHRAHHYFCSHFSCAGVQANQMKRRKVKFPLSYLESHPLLVSAAVSLIVLSIYYILTYRYIPIFSPFLVPRCQSSLVSPLRQA